MLEVDGEGAVGVLDYLIQLLALLIGEVRLNVLPLLGDKVAELLGGGVIIKTAIGAVGGALLEFAQIGSPRGEEGILGDGGGEVLVGVEAGGQKCQGKNGGGFARARRVGAEHVGESPRGWGRRAAYGLPRSPSSVVVPAG